MPTDGDDELLKVLHVTDWNCSLTLNSTQGT